MPQGRQRTTCKKMMEKNLNNYNLNWDSATEMAKDREHWKNCCRKMSFPSKSLSDTSESKSYSVMLIACTSIVLASNLTVRLLKLGGYFKQRFLNYFTNA